MTAKKPVTLVHPDSGQKVEVTAGDEEIYVSQGWVPADAKND